MPLSPKKKDIQKIINHHLSHDKILTRKNRMNSLNE